MGEAKPRGFATRVRKERPNARRKGRVDARSTARGVRGTETSRSHRAGQKLRRANPKGAAGPGMRVENRDSAGPRGEETWRGQAGRRNEGDRAIPDRRPSVRPHGRTVATVNAEAGSSDRRHDGQRIAAGVRRREKKPQERHPGRPAAPRLRKCSEQEAGGAGSVWFAAERLQFDRGRGAEAQHQVTDDAAMDP